MSKTLEKILEDELFKTEEFEGLGSLSIKNTSKDTKMQVNVEGNSFQEKRDGYNKAPLIAESQDNDGVLFTVNPNESFTAKGVVGANTHSIKLSEFDFMPYLDKPMTLSCGYVVTDEYNACAIISSLTDNSNKTLRNNAFNIDKGLNSDHKTGTVSSDDLDTSNGVKLVVNLYFNTASQGTKIDISGYLQFVEGTENKPYEQYCTTPSKKIPSEIKSAGDEGNINFTVSNPNVAKIEEDVWELTNNNTIKNKSGNANTILTRFKLKKGQTLHTYLKLLSKPQASSSFSLFVDSVTVGSSYGFSTFNNFNLDEIYTRTYTAEKDCSILYRMYGNADNDTFEFQFWAEIDTLDLANKYIPYEEVESKSIAVQKPFRAVNGNRDTFIVKNGKWYEQHKIKRIESYNNEEINTEYMSSTGGLDVGATVDYILTEPEEIECTEEQNKVLNKLQRILSYENITNIIYTDETECNFKVTAKVSKIKELEEQVKTAQIGE